MSNIAKAFANGKAFIPFITCGDPDLETTAAAAVSYTHLDVYKRQVVSLLNLGSTSTPRSIFILVGPA